MRYIVLSAAVLMLFISCNKDKYTSAPQIKFKSITPAFEYGVTQLGDGPKLTLEVTDAEGDLGFEVGKDSSYVFIKCLKAPFKSDSFRFPAAVNGIVTKNFKADVSIDLQGDGFNGGGVLNPPATGQTDTLYFEVYVKDLKKNKSNVIQTPEPLYYIRP